MHVALSFDNMQVPISDLPLTPGRRNQCENSPHTLRHDLCLPGLENLFLMHTTPQNSSLGHHCLGEARLVRQ